MESLVGLDRHGDGDRLPLATFLVDLLCYAFLKILLFRAKSRMELVIGLRDMH